MKLIFAQTAPSFEALSPMRIMMLIHSLGPGGAERVMIQLAIGLHARGHEVTINTLGASSDDCIYSLDPGIPLVPLGLNRLPRHKGTIWTILQVLELIRGVRRHFHSTKPEIVISFINTTNIFALLATTRMGLPVVISERSDPAITPLRRIWKVARQLTYPFASVLVVQSEEVRSWFPPWVRRNIWVIPNPVLPPAHCLAPREENGSTRRVIAVGRLAYEKGFDLLLEVFGRLASRFSDWNLEIWGEGPLRGELEALREKLGLRHRVDFPGITSDIHSRYAQADIFVLSSRFEGFPNALCEAMAMGLPVVATSCSGGVRDIIRPGVDGLLVPPENAVPLADALATLMGDSGLRKSLGSSAENIITRFSLDSVLDQWETCMEQAQRLPHKN